MNEPEIRQLLNQVLKDLFYKILRLQEKSVSQASDATVSRMEMHILEAVQDGQEVQEVTLTRIADALKVTKATASVSIKRLIEKGYLHKDTSEADRRKRILMLTSRGEECCKKHKQFHDMMVESLLHDFEIGDYPYVLKSLHALLDFFGKIER